MKMAFAFCDANEDGFVDMNDILMSMRQVGCEPSGKSKEKITDAFYDFCDEGLFLDFDQFRDFIFRWNDAEEINTLFDAIYES